MKQYIPHKFIKYHKDLTNRNLNDLYGFFEVEVETPKDINKPLLPYKYQGETIYPSGK